MQKTVFVTAFDGTALMPTSAAKARKLLSAGKAVIHQHRPFAIRLTYESGRGTQPVELCMDTGSEHIGVSIKSEKHEYVHAQYDSLLDEKERHEKQKTHRRMRRNRLRCRKKRYDNRRSLGAGQLQVSDIRRITISVLLACMQKSVP